ncbi:uncharacterized protein LOC106670320 [Cimex lectularius]|uniref:Uncharacterized protein n=1 Tax=Cimex lectularius TaxID=79782 RepID=A0A8I6TGI9_CIMLE|nr:uncharacterized protein LOC106670320 [Cimex lectularius]
MLTSDSTNSQQESELCPTSPCGTLYTPTNFVPVSCPPKCMPACFLSMSTNSNSTGKDRRRLGYTGFAGYGGGRQTPAVPEPGELASKFSIVGGEVHRICKCTRRNGLQDDCPMPGCRGNPKCLETPFPTCAPAGFIDSPTTEQYPILCCCSYSQNSEDYPLDDCLQFVSCPNY